MYNQIKTDQTIKYNQHNSYDHCDIFPLLPVVHAYSEKSILFRGVLNMSVFTMIVESGIFIPIAVILIYK